MLAKLILATAAPVLVGAFGHSSNNLDACDTCLCDNDPVIGDSPEGQQKCCPKEDGIFPETFDNYCDLILVDKCKDVCTKDGKRTSKRQQTRVSFRSNTQNQAVGAICGGLFTGFTCMHHCYMQQANYGVCTRFVDGVRDALQQHPGLSITEEGGKIVITSPNSLGREELSQYASVVKSRFNLASLPTITPRTNGRLLQSSRPGGYQYEMENPKVQSDFDQFNPYPYPSTSTASGPQCANLPTGGVSSSALYQQWGVELLTFDWDKTACTEHTFKASYHSYCDLAQKVSKDYVATVEKWCSTHPNGDTAIVTYNDAISYIGGRQVQGPDMIRNTLDIVLTPACADKIKIYARNDQQPGAGKTWHLQGAQRDYGFNLRNAVTLLVDDTANNIDIARSKNPAYQTVWVNPANGYKKANNDCHDKRTSQCGGNGGNGGQWGSQPQWGSNQWGGR